MKSKTPLQQMLQHIDAMQEHLSPMAYVILKDKATECAFREHAMILTAHYKGQKHIEDLRVSSSVDFAKEFYNETFN